VCWIDSLREMLLFVRLLFVYPCPPFWIWGWFVRSSTAHGLLMSCACALWVFVELVEDGLGRLV